MKAILKREIPFLTIISVPLLYLNYVWLHLPEKVPIHWNIAGQADGWTDKKGLLITILSILISFYFFWLLMLHLGSKNWILRLGYKFDQLRFAFMLFISFISIYIIHSAVNNTTSISLIMILIGGLISVLGNYMRSVKPNYYFGVRTPWTLKNEIIWKKTHNFSSKLWLIGGLFITVSSLFFNQKKFMLFLIIVLIITMIPIVYSYNLYRQSKK